MLDFEKEIAKWANDTFGRASNLSIAARANQEMAELLMCLANDDNDPHAVEECADVLIVLVRIAENHGVSLMDAVKKKMAVNKERTWNKTGNGHGYHV